MQLFEILVFSITALLLRFFIKGKWRGWILMTVSVLAIYWLQPAMPIRYLDFWLPTMTLVIAALSWILTAKNSPFNDQDNRLAGFLIIGLVILVGLTRYLSLEGIVTPNRPPAIHQVALVLTFFLLITLLLVRTNQSRGVWLWGGFIVLLVLFLILKVPELSLLASKAFREMMSQSVTNASPMDIRWLGFSYVAFRLIHTIRDRQNGRLPEVTLQEYLNYVIFFPAFTAGPIDRLSRFVKDLRQPTKQSLPQLGEAITRLVVGIFKKFALADTLALIALNTQSATQVQGAGWTWILIYAYTFQIFFDFSGYTDIAIGIGMILGIQLPENFNRPYLQSNLTQFWNNWHMTLTHWFRAYFFNPLTRYLRSNHRSLSIGWIIFLTQISTMILIGMWHGVTLNFLVWGAWHGLGLFVQNRFSDWFKPRSLTLQNRPSLQKLLNGFNTVFTFHFVALGWVWFALPSLGLSWDIILKGFGLGS